MWFEKAAWKKKKKLWSSCQTCLYIYRRKDSKEMSSLLYIRDVCNQVVFFLLLLLLLYFLIFPFLVLLFQLLLIYLIDWWGETHKVRNCDVIEVEQVKRRRTWQAQQQPTKRLQDIAHNMHGWEADFIYFYHYYNDIYTTMTKLAVNSWPGELCMTTTSVWLSIIALNVCIFLRWAISYHKWQKKNKLLKRKSSFFLLLPLSLYSLSKLITLSSSWPVTYYIHSGMRRITTTVWGSRFVVVQLMFYWSFAACSFESETRVETDEKCAHLLSHRSNKHTTANCCVFLVIHSILKIL